MAAKKQVKIGLALGGGGARGLAHIGVFRVLEREQVPIAFIAGTSMGGLIGAMVAKGLSSAEIEAEATDFSRWSQFIRLLDINLRLRMRGLLRGGRIYRYMSERLGDDLRFSPVRGN